MSSELNSVKVTTVQLYGCKVTIGKKVKNDKYVFDAELHIFLTF